MNLFRWAPRAGAWASAVALFAYAWVVSLSIAMVMPFIAELMRHSPRLGWLAILAVWVCPIGGAAAIHHTAHAVLDIGEGKQRAHRAASLWAGFVAWATIILVSMTTAFAMLVIDPPPVDESSFFALALDSMASWHGFVHALVWIALAAGVYALERAAHRDA